MARTALVTGASSGIGAATAAALLTRGFRVVGTSRDPAAIGDRAAGVEYVRLDLEDDDSIAACAAPVGDVDVLVNNAGDSQSGPLEELPPEAIERLFRVNVFGPVRLTQLVLPGIGERRTHYLRQNTPFAGEYRTMIEHLDANERAGPSADAVAATIVTAIEAEHPRPLCAVGSNAPLVFTFRRLLPRPLVETMTARRHGMR